MRAVATVADVNPRQAWMALPHRTRLDAVHWAKQGRAHPEPRVRLAAMAWGRYAPIVIGIRAILGLAASFAVLIVSLSSDGPFLIGILGLLPMVAFAVGMWYAQHRWEGWDQMLGPVNGRRVLLDQAGTARPLEVGPSFRARSAVPGYLLLAVAGPVAIALTGWHLGTAVLLAASAAWLAWRAYRRPRRLPQPPLRIDGSGVTFHHLGWTIPWSAIASCDLTDHDDQTVSRRYDTAPGGARKRRRASFDRYDDATGVAWRLRRKSLKATLATIPEPVRKTVTAWLEKNAYAVVLGARRLSQPPELVAAASQRYLDRSGGGKERISPSRSRGR